MVLRRRVGAAVQMPYKAPGRPILPENDMRIAQPGLDRGDGARSNEIASVDCAARVADVLNRLGYGFCAIPYGSSALQRARARFPARAALS